MNEYLGRYLKEYFEHFGITLIWFLGLLSFLVFAFFSKPISNESGIDLLM